MKDDYRSPLRPSEPPYTETSLPILYARYVRELSTYARRRVGKGPPEPEDLVQQAFANFAGLQNPAAVKNPRAFLYRVIANLITDHNRSAGHRRTVDVADEDLEELSEDQDEISPEIVLLDRERFSKVAETIRALPRRQRRFLLLNRFHGMTYTEIARRNGVSIMTAKREVDAAIRKCRLALDALGEGQ